MRIVIDTVARELNSVNGNPRWRVLTRNDRIYRTARDTAAAYDISAHTPPGTEVEVELNRQGEIIRWQPV